MIDDQWSWYYDLYYHKYNKYIIFNMFLYECSGVFLTENPFEKSHIDFKNFSQYWVPKIVLNNTT